jgi:hypothetical protein
MERGGFCDYLYGDLIICSNNSAKLINYDKTQGRLLMCESGNLVLTLYRVIHGVLLYDTDLVSE